MSSAWPEAKAPSTPARKTRRRTLLKRWLGVSEVEWKNFQRLAGKMLHHSSDDPRIQLEMGDVGHVQPNSRSSGKAQ